MEVMDLRTGDAETSELASTPGPHLFLHKERKKSPGNPWGFSLRSSMKTSQIELAHHSKLFCTG